MAQQVLPQVVRCLAPDCLPLFLSDGFKDYLPAILAHFGSWVRPARCRTTGPAPKPRWMPLSALLYTYCLPLEQCRSSAVISSTSDEQRGVARRWPGGEKSICGRASHREACAAMESLIFSCALQGCH